MILNTKKKDPHVFVLAKFLETLKFTFFGQFVQPINVRRSQTFFAIFPRSSFFSYNYYY